MTTAAAIATMGVRAVIVVAFILVFVIAVGRLEAMIALIARLWFDREGH